MKLSSGILSFLVGVSGHGASTRCGEVRFGNEGEFPITSLSSYPGSGNTWVRYLIEEYTGYYTGSIYTDKNLAQGGFKGEMKDWKSGQMVAIKAHSFRNERPLEDAILLIRNPYDAILAEFNRVRGYKGGDHHTGLATLEDFLSESWIDMDIEKRAFRWFKLYFGNLTNRDRTLPIFYEDLKRLPIPEMEKIGEFLNITDVDSVAKFDCMFSDHSNRFKRSSTREYDPWDFVAQEKFDIINMYIQKLNNTLLDVHGIELPEDYIRIKKAPMEAVALVDNYEDPK
jgi:hypothetical protein